MIDGRETGRSVVPGGDLLRMAGIGVRFADTLVLDGVEFAVAHGEVHALLGENGAGKSSLMKVLAGALRPAAGAMTLAGVPYAPADPRAAMARGVAMIYQELTVLPHLSVADNVLLGCEEVGWGGLVARRRRDARVAAAFALLQRHDLALGARVQSLSPADRQIVEIARALCRDARLLVMDEPTSSLGSRDVARLFAVIAELRRRGLGIVYISHALDEVRAIADRYTVLRDGAVVARGRMPDTADQELVTAMAGRPLELLFPPHRERPGEAVLTIDGLSGAGRPVHASLVLHRGEIVGIAGLGGAGRTELLEALFGLRPRTGGSAMLRGQPLPGTPAACWSAQIGMLVEDRKQQGLCLRLPVATNTVLPRLADFASAGRVSWRAVAAATNRQIERLSVRCRGPFQPVGELSGGNQQKVAFARLLAAGVDVLLLDEPTRGIDVGARQEVYALLDAEARRGAAVLVVSSSLPELLGLCDRIAVMSRGRLGEARPASEWSQETLLAVALQLEDQEPDPSEPAAAGPEARP